MDHEQALHAARDAYYNMPDPADWTTGVDAAVRAYLTARAEDLARIVFEAWQEKDPQFNTVEDWMAHEEWWASVNVMEMSGAELLMKALLADFGDTP